MPGRSLFAVLVTAGLAICGAAACSSDPSTPPAPTAVQVSVTSCGVGWTHTAAGAQHVTVQNTDSRPGEAQLIAPATGAVYADIEPLGPGTTADVDVSLSAGRYAWRCLMEDEAAVTGNPLAITGTARGTTPGIRPVSQADLVDATRTYQHYVARALPGLAALTTTLRTAIATDNLAAARRAWLPAHLEYERLGAAYDAFGNLDGAINGLPDGLPRGVHDPQWTGFHRIEYGLWHAQPARTLLPVAERLRTDVDALRTKIASTDIDPLQIAIRAHEISENALQFELTGRTDFGSHSQLDTVHANLQGTSVVLQIIHSLIAPRYPMLPQTLAQLTRTETDLAQHASHTELDADISQLCELLAPVAAILEPRRNS